MAELKPNYSQLLWEAWKEYEKRHGALSGVELARRVEKRVGGVFDDTKLSRIRSGKRRATVEEHYALATELEIDPDKLAGQRPDEPEPVLRKNRSRRVTEADLDREEREEKKRKSRRA